MHWYLDVVKNYTGFTGRARRQEFWMFGLINFGIMIVLSIVEGIIGTYGIIGFLYFLAILLPAIAVSIRRIHDTDRSGWWLLISLTGIGIILLLIFYCLEGTPGDNQYGPDPKAA